MNIHKIKTTRSALIAIALALPNAGYAATFLDDFSTDTSANYTGTDTFNSGGSFTVLDGFLNVTNGTNNTYNVFHNTAQLEAGEFVGVTVPVGTATDFYLTVSTIKRGPNTGTEDGIRYNLDDDGVRTRTYRDGGVTNSGFTAVTGWTSDLTLYIYRDDNVSYRVGYDSGSGYTETGSITLTETAATAGLFIGVEGYAPTMTVRAFDNLTVAAVPEPSSAALLGLGGVALILRRRK